MILSAQNVRAVMGDFLLVVAQAKIAVPAPNAVHPDSVVSRDGVHILYDVASAPHSLLSTQDFNTALIRLLHLDVPVGAFLETLDRLSPHPLPLFSDIVHHGLISSISSELRAQDETLPTTISPEVYRDLYVNSEAVLHAMTNRWQYLCLLDSEKITAPEVGDWTTHMAQFVFLTVDLSYPNEDGPPVLNE